MSDLPKLYVIIDRATLDARGLQVGAFARELAETGVRLVQYRDKLHGPQEILRAMDAIAEAFQGTDAKLVLNDRADLAALRGWGVHVGQGDLPVEAAFHVLQADENSRFPAGMTKQKEAIEAGAHVVGVSTHTEAQVREADGLSAMCEPTSRNRDVGHTGLRESAYRNRDGKCLGGATYIAIGPVFATATKKDAEPVVGLEGVRRARALTQKPLVAIGGITLENCASVIDAGADAVAVIGGMFVEGRAVAEIARDFLERLR